MLLTYKIVYTPNKDTKQSILDNSVNFLCSDDKIHIRLRDYDHEEVIHGFIDKLTYAITYLFQRAVIQEPITNNIIEKVVNSDDSLKILNDWVVSLFKGCKGLKVSKNYRKIKKNKETPLGSFLPGTCPLINDVSYGDIQFLNRAWNILEFYDILLNDAIDIVITKDVSKSCYEKFTNKQVRKVKKNKLEYIPLF